MPPISRIEVRPRPLGYFRFDFIVDGVPLLDRFSLEFLEPEAQASRGSNEEKAGDTIKNMQATRLGNGSRDWQLSALDQLLLRAKPELPDGRRRLYVCGGDCECSHIACFMERRESLIVWQEFQYGSPSHSQAEVFRNGTWERVDFGSGPGPKGFDLPSRPLYFEEFAYRKVFEPLYDKLVNDKGLRT